MNRLSNRINRLSESATIAMAQKSRELKNQGKDIISLSLGEPDFNTPDFVKIAAKEAIDNNYTKYMAVPGYEDLREAISHKFKRDNNIDYSIDQIVVSTGAKQSIANVVLALIDEGDEVVIPAPYWVTYIEIVKMAGGTPIVVEASLENDFKITGQQLEEAITDKTRLMIFSNPCNPTGSIYTEAELKDLAQTIEKHEKLVVISDEIYELIRFDGPHISLAQFNNIYNQVVTVNGVSKAFAMTGWRLGYIGAPLDIAKACVKMQGQFTSGTCSISQRAAIAAVKADPDEATKTMVTAFEKRRKLVLDRLNKMEGVKTNVPGGAFYVFPDITYYFGKSYNGNTIQDANDLCLYLLEYAEVALVTGQAFGADNCIRISYAASEAELIEAMNRIENALEKLS